VTLPARAGSTAWARVLGGLVSGGLAIGACEPLDIALYPPAPDAGVKQPVDVSPPSREELPDAASEPAPAAPDAMSPSSPCAAGATACDACVSSGKCALGTVCQPLTGDCVIPCADGTDCPARNVCNPLLGVCVECIDASDCTTNPALAVCDTRRGVCVECLTSDDCVAEPLLRPVCLDGFNRCGCAGDDDCPVGYCETREAHCELTDD
jgi:hypothetical protein